MGDVCVSRYPRTSSDRLRTKEGPGAPDSCARFVSLSPLVLAAVLLGGYSLNMFDPIEGPYAGPNTRLGLATVVIWHNADHYDQMIIYLRLNGIVPPASRGNPPALQDNY